MSCKNVSTHDFEVRAPWYHDTHPHKCTSLRSDTRATRQRKQPYCNFGEQRARLCDGSLKIVEWLCSRGMFAAQQSRWSRSKEQKSDEADVQNGEDDAEALCEVEILPLLASSTKPNAWIKEQEQRDLSWDHYSLCNAKSDRRCQTHPVRVRVPLFAASFFPDVNCRHMNNQTKATSRSILRDAASITHSQTM